MELTGEEEKMLDGEHGEWVSKAIKLLIRLGELSGAEKLVKINRSHISGVSYKTAGDATLDMLKDIAKTGVKVKTYATLNPAGMDADKWQEMGVPEYFAIKQRELIEAYIMLGVKPALTCAPYFFENRPKRNEIVAFAESSAIVFTNSIIGARTNRHGSIDVLAASLTGRVPYSGLHLDENRKANVLVDVKENELSESDYGFIGIFVGGRLNPSDIPAFVFNHRPIIDNLRYLGAALAASGAIAMFHAIGITPEAKTKTAAFGNNEPVEKISVGREEIKKVKEELFSEIDEPDAIFIGCPHASVDEIKKLAMAVKNKDLKEGLRFWVFTSRFVKEKIENEGLLNILENAGIRVYTDTCMVVAPIEELGLRRIITNSLKAAWYIPKFAEGKVIVDVKPIDDIVDLYLKS